MEGRRWGMKKYGRVDWVPNWGGKREAVGGSPYFATRPWESRLLFYSSLFFFSPLKKNISQR